MKNNNWGGAREGSGRKKGIGLSFTIQKHCQSFIEEILKDEAIKRKAIKQLETNYKKVEHYIYIIKGKWFNLTEEEVISTTQKLYKESYGW